MTRKRRPRALTLALCGALALGGSVRLRGARAAEPQPWAAQNDMPIPAGVRSAEVMRDDELLYQAPSSSAERRGAVARGARLPVYGAERGAGCNTRFLLVGPLAWLCADGAQLTSAAPGAIDGAPLSHSHDGLPYRYHFVGPGGSFGYRSLQTAEDGVPDAELLKGFGVAVIRVENNPQGTAFGLTSEGLWVPMRDLSPIVPLDFHGRELKGTLNVAWVVSHVAFASHAPDKPKDPRQQLARFQEIDVLEERQNGGHRWFRFANSAWLSDRDVRAPTHADPPSELRPGERWLDVDVASQTLTAYVGDQPVFATLVSTGLGAEGSSLATPRGTHRLWVKLRTSTMANLDDESATETYALQAVPWVMFFDHGYGLHGTFWHHEFGTRHSHGCVNLSALDAERLFAWTSPRLPAGWTSALPTRYEQGTLIRVR